MADQPKESTRDQFDIKMGKLNNKINEKKQINQEQALEKRLGGAPITSNWSAICKSESTQSYDYLPQCLLAGLLLSLITDICQSFIYDYAHFFKN